MKCSGWVVSVSVPGVALSRSISASSLCCRLWSRLLDLSLSACCSFNTRKAAWDIFFFTAASCSSSGYGGVGVFVVHPSYYGRQCKALQYQCHQYHGKGNEEDEAPFGEAGCHCRGIPEWTGRQPGIPPRAYLPSPVSGDPPKAGPVVGGIDITAHPNGENGGAECTEQP